jgi:hypothetical protein
VVSVDDPRREMAEPFRRALDALVLRWVGIYLLAASVVVCPFLCGAGIHEEHLIHACLPVFLVGFIAVHLIWRRPAPRHDGWQRAFEEDPRDARLAVGVGLAAIAGLTLALVAIFCPLGDQMALAVALGIWLPILAPLYAGAIWVSIDCSIRRLGSSADSADSSFRDYWRHVAEHGPR